MKPNGFFEQGREEHARDKQRAELVRKFRLRLTPLDEGDIEEHVIACREFLEKVGAL